MTQLHNYEEYCAPKGLSFKGGAFGIMHQKTGIKDKGRPNCRAIVVLKYKGKRTKTFVFFTRQKYKDKGLYLLGRQ